MAHLDRSTWVRPPLFDWLQQHGNVADEEMLRVFNCGIGMIVVIAPEHAATAIDSLHTSNETVWQIGEIKQRQPETPAIVIA